MDTVTFDLPPRFNTASSLVATFQSAEQRVENLTVNKASNVSYAFTAQQFIFNVEDYMDKFGKAAIEEIATEVEADVATVCETAPYRFYGDGITQISTFGQLGNALAMFRNYGAAKDKTRVVLSDIAESNIVNSGLNQFTKRNDEMSMSWEVGDFNRAMFYRSNLLPLHTAGNVGNNATTLTVVSVTKNADDAVTSITFSGASASDADAIKQHDRIQFNDGVSGQTDMRYRTFIGHRVSQNPVQVRATADAASTGAGQVTVSITPALKASSGKAQNINTEVAVGMQVSVLPNHRAGLIYAGDALYIGMPRLPEEVPFPTANQVDEDTGVSMRQYYGSLFGQNERGMIHDVIWGKTLVPEYSMALIFPE